MPTQVFEFPEYECQGMSIPSFSARPGDDICIKIGRTSSLEWFAQSFAEQVVIPEHGIVGICISDVKGHESDTSHSWLTRALRGNAALAETKLSKLGIRRAASVESLAGNDRRLLSVAAIPSHVSLVTYHLYGLDPEGRLKLSRYLNDELSMCIAVQVCFDSMPNDAIVWPSGSSGLIICYVDKLGSGFNY